MLDDVEDKIVGAAKGPDREGEVNGDFPVRGFEKKERGGQDPDDEEHPEFQPHQAGVFEVGHEGIYKMGDGNSEFVF